VLASKRLNAHQPLAAAAELSAVLTLTRNGVVLRLSAAMSSHFLFVLKWSVLTARTLRVSTTARYLERSQFVSAC
jgi:hypothetical protein